LRSEGYIKAQILAHAGDAVFRSMAQKAWIFRAFLGLIWVCLGSKTSLFLYFENAKSFICNRWLGLFRQKSIFFAFLADFLPPPGQFRSHFPRRI
jgi:hypothetical protein